MLDFSQRRELSLHAELAVDVNGALAALGMLGIIVGAFVRDLHLHYGAGIPIQRGTEDIDFAFMVSSWSEFDALRTRLIESGACGAVEGKRHRLRHQNKLAIDLVPFGSIETENRHIAWPPKGDMVMDVFGFREALGATDEVSLPGDVKVQIVSLASLAFLKIVAWNDRHRRVPGKDAADLMLIVRNYLAVEANRERLWDNFNEWTQEDTFDYEHGGARMLGHDIRQLLDKRGIEKIAAILRPQIDGREIGELPQEMNHRSPEQAQQLLQSLHDELVRD